MRFSRGNERDPLALTPTLTPPSSSFVFSRGGGGVQGQHVPRRRWERGVGRGRVGSRSCSGLSSSRRRRDLRPRRPWSPPAPPNSTVSVIGDGAMTEGQAYEALNNAGYPDTNMIVVLNDNKQVSLPTATLDGPATPAHMVPDSRKEHTYCVYDSDIATGFGVAALLLLLAGQALLMCASRCFCCGRALRPGGSRACALLLFLLCWLTFVVAEACLLAGSVRNAYHTKYRYMLGGDDNPSCQTLRKGVFAAGAAFVFFTAVLSEFYYVCYSRARSTGDAAGAPYGKAAAVGMGTYH